MDVKEAFAGWVKAGAEVSKIKDLIKDLDHELVLANNAEMEARDLVGACLAETGEYEVLIEGEYCNYKILYTTPKKSIKVENPDAVPDRLCKIERKPLLREIGQEMAALAEAGEPMPNWATEELGTSKLAYKVIKK